MKSFYYNRLPHLTPKGRCFFVTFCTFDSIPIHHAIQWNEINFIEQFEVYDKALDFGEPTIDICKIEFAESIKKSILQDNNILYEVLYYCIMPNHVHLVLDTECSPENTTLGNIMKLIKGRSSKGINLLLNRTGTIWQKASYDRMIRNEKELSSIGDYILNNPVKSGKVQAWEDWPYNYVRFEN